MRITMQLDWEDVKEILMKQKELNDQAMKRIKYHSERFDKKYREILSYL